MFENWSISIALIFVGSLYPIIIYFLIKSNYYRGRLPATKERIEYSKGRLKFNAFFGALVFYIAALVILLI